MYSDLYSIVSKHSIKRPWNTFSFLKEKYLAEYQLSHQSLTNWLGPKKLQITDATNGGVSLKFLKQGNFLNLYKSSNLTEWPIGQNTGSAGSELFMSFNSLFFYFSSSSTQVSKLVFYVASVSLSCLSFVKLKLISFNSCLNFSFSDFRVEITF